ncbi:MAG: hypothetical protein WC438_04930 [Candidatus Pacearchaeota archaeon]
MAKRCAICNEKISENFGKLEGTLIKILENSVNQFLYVCNDCQKNPDWREKAIIKGA